MRCCARASTPKSCRMDDHRRTRLDARRDQEPALRRPLRARGARRGLQWPLALHRIVCAADERHALPARVDVRAGRHAARQRPHDHDRQRRQPRLGRRPRVLRRCAGRRIAHPAAHGGRRRGPARSVVLRAGRDRSVRRRGRHAGMARSAAGGLDPRHRHPTRRGRAQPHGRHRPPGARRSRQPSTSTNSCSTSSRRAARGSERGS